MAATGLITATLAGRPMAFGRTDLTPRLRDLSISDQLGEIPNTARCRVQGVTPTGGMEFIAILAGSTERIFGGLVLAVHQSSIAKATDLEYDLQCIDYTWLLNRRQVTKQYTATTAGAILADLVATFTSGFTATAVETAAGTTAIDELTFTHEDVTDALSRLAQRIGAYWYCDYTKDIHFFFSETGNNPTALTAQHPTLEPESVAVSTDLSQIVTRVRHEGAGSDAADGRGIGATTLPVRDRSPFNAAGGTVITGAQELTYTGLGTFGEYGAWSPRSAAAGYKMLWVPALAKFFCTNLSQNIRTSPDGVTWSTVDTGIAGLWQSIAYSPSLALLVLVGPAGKVATSPDGTTWTERTAAAANQWRDVCWASGSIAKFVAVSDNGTNRVMHSADGITWTSAAAASALAWWGVDYAPALDLLVAVAASASANAIMSSANATSWTTRTNPTSNTLYDVVWSAEHATFVAVGSTGSAGVIASSTTGTSWTSRTNPITIGHEFYGVTWSAEEARFVAVIKVTSGSLYYVAYSDDGITWYASQIPTGGHDAQSLAWSPTLGLFAIVGYPSTGEQLSTMPGNAQGMLTGIPASGPGSIGTAIEEGAPVNLLVTVNDTAAQAALAAQIGGDGVQEDYLQDSRLSEAEATARAEAHLELHKSPEIRLQYRCRDILTKAGRTITVPGYAGSLLEQTPAGYWRLGERGYSRQVMASTPVGFWRLDEASGTVADDEVGSNDGTYTNTPTLGVVGPISDHATATSFASASNEYVTMGDVAAFEFTGAFSAEAWVKTTSASGQAIVGKFASSNIGWLVFMTGGVVRFLACTSGSVAVFTFDTTPTYHDDAWHHVVCTWDGTTDANKVQIYVDGVVVKQGTASAGTPGTGTDPFVVGAYSSSFLAQFTGSIADVAVYTRELTAVEIAAHYAARLQTDATVSAQAADASGNARHGTYTNGPELGAAPALHDGNTGITLAGASYITMGDVAAFELTGAISVEYWQKHAALVAAEQAIVGKMSTDGKGYRATMLTTGKIRWLLQTSVPATIALLDTVRAYNDGLWHYVVHTWTGDTSSNGVKTYIDGVLENQTTAGAGALPSGLTDPFVIGAYGAGFGLPWVGSLDEVAIYAAVLTPAQIATRYAQRRWTTDTLGDLTIQHVEIDGFSERDPDLMPLHTVEASSVRFSFEDVLRRVPRERRESTVR